MGVGAAVAIPCAAATLAGFGAAGIVGGSIAAATQASIGNVVAGSAFATLQSLGATGTLVSGIYGGGTVLAAGVASAAVSGGQTSSCEMEDDPDESEESMPLVCPCCGHPL